jgi:hypothetical protein
MQHVAVASAASQFGFLNPCATDADALDKLPQHLPLLIVRAGRDQMPHLNESADSFVQQSLAICRCS